MQATGEELETPNEELCKAIIEQPNTTNEELAARSNELERLGHERDAELLLARPSLATLRAVVERTPLIVCLLDKNSKQRCRFPGVSCFTGMSAMPASFPGCMKRGSSRLRRCSCKMPREESAYLQSIRIPLPAKVADTMLASLRPLDDASGS